MSEQLEIEFKNLLTAAEFAKLQHYFSILDEEFKIQHNHYFDSEQFSLKDKGCALRIREKNGKYECTLKQPHPDGLLETNEDLPVPLAQQIIKQGHFQDSLPVNSPIIAALNQLNIQLHSLTCFGSLKTSRAETVYKNGLLVLDNSFYLNKEDFELEYEVSNREEGEQHFHELLIALGIPLRHTDNKIKRFYQQKMNTL